MFRIKGNLRLPDSLKEIVNSIPPYDDKSIRTEPSAYLGSFKQKINPVLLCTLFGLYKSQELPPMDKKEITVFSKLHDFNVEIGEFADLLNHFLFCLWVKKNGTPDKHSDLMNYRRDIYNFIERLFDPDYYRNVLIPFYLSKADEKEGGTSSFIHRLASSDSVKVELVDHSPEFLAREFAAAQDEFVNNVILAFGEVQI